MAGMALPENPILVLGMSHIGAIARARSCKQRSRIRVVSIRNREGLFDAEGGGERLAGLAPFKPAYVFMSIGGNFYNRFGLVENPVPLAIGQAPFGKVPLGHGRRFVPFDMIAEHFEKSLRGRMMEIARLSEHYRNTPLHHLAPPPPIRDISRLERNAGSFAGRFSRGVAPAELRMALYRIQSDIYRRHCERLGVAFVEPPKAAVDSEGYLSGSCHLENDLTHGNTRYGSMVLEQIEALASG